MKNKSKYRPRTPSKSTKLPARNWGKPKSRGYLGKLGEEFCGDSFPPPYVKAVEYRTDALNCNLTEFQSCPSRFGCNSLVTKPNESAQSSPVWHVIARR